jgi:PAS domain S-box-containing protein
VTEHERAEPPLTSVDAPTDVLVSVTLDALGPTLADSAELRVATQICLRARQAMAVWAGPSLAVIANEQYWNALGCPGPSTLGLPAAELWASAWPLLGPRVAAAQRGEAWFEVDEPLLLGPPIHADRSEAFLSHSLTPIVSLQSRGSLQARENQAPERIVGLVHVLENTSARVRRQRQLERVFELAHGLLVVGDDNDRWVEVNPAFTRVLGWSRAEALARPRSALIHPDDFGPTEAVRKSLAAGDRAVDFEIRFQHADGSYRWLAWTAASVPEEGLIFAAARDVTEQRRAEEQERQALARADFRLRLADSLRPLGDPIEIQRCAAGELGRTLAASRVHYAIVSADAEVGIVNAEHRDPGLPSVIGRHCLDEYGRALMNEIRAGRTLIVDDVAGDARLREHERAATMALGIGAYVILPLMKSGRLVALLVVHQDRARTWTPADLGLIEDTGERTWAAVEQAQVEEALRESEARLQQTLRHASAGVFDWDIPTGELYWSPENYALHGVDPSVALHYGAWERAVLPEDRPATLERIDAAIAGRTPEFNAEYRVIHPQLGLRWLLGVGKVERGPAGEPIRMRGLNLDISDRKQIEQQAREADRRKTEFLAVLSHELRNPLAPIRNSVELLRVVPADSEVAERAKQVLDRQSSHLVQIIDDLLDVTRISRGKIRLDRQRLDLREVVHRTAEDLWTSFEAGGVALSLELAPTPVWVEADPTRVAQVVTNLLQNSLKFAPGGAVSVAVEASNERACLRVRDNGVGMRPEELPQMFEPFAQVEQQLARSLGGLGLGLALVKGLVELHGGEVEASSPGPGQGSEFVVALPLASAGEDAATSASAEQREPALRILIIEDNRDAGQTLADLLRVRGHDVRLASDGRTGLRIVASFAPAVVICDIGLPDLTGYEVAAGIRAQPHAAAIPSLGPIPDPSRDPSTPPRPPLLIALSGYAQPEDRARAAAAGFDAHLPKPAPLEQLYALLASAAEPSPPEPKPEPEPEPEPPPEPRVR